LLSFMRAVCVAFCALTLTLGCASTVHRLDGEVPTAAGPAKNLCEKQDWLVIAPTRAEFSKPGEKTSERRDDGLGLYKVGSSSPESIPQLREEFPDSPLVQRHAQAVRKHDDQRLIAAGLGAAGLIALGIGTMLFVSSFENSRDAHGQETQTANGGRALASGLVVAGGFGLGISGILVNPNQTERSRADATRHAFFRPEDDPHAVEELVVRHNTQVRAHCAHPAVSE
jgi:hypothetical protein